VLATSSQATGFTQDDARGSCEVGVKLPAYGLSGNLLAWLAEFMHNRSQIVKLNNSYSHSARHKWCTTWQCPWPDIVSLVY